MRTIKIRQGKGLAMETEAIISRTDSKMEKALESVQYELASIRTGRANPLILDRVSVDYYGTPSSLRQVANISVQEGQTLVIQPYEKNMLEEISKALSKSDLNLPVNNDGSVLRLSIPPLTQERRKELARQVRKIGEEGKVLIRNLRRDAGSEADKCKKSENWSEDILKDVEAKIQKVTNRYTQQIDELINNKETEVMSV
jgi:ribosome recycling factor